MQIPQYGFSGGVQMPTYPTTSYGFYPGYGYPSLSSGGGGSSGHSDRDRDTHSGGHSGYAGSSYGHSSFGGHGGHGDSMSGLGANLYDVNWGKENLIEARKDFYQETVAVASRSSTEVEDWLKNEGIRRDCRAGGTIPNPIFSFEDAEFPKHYMDVLKGLGYTKPTKIQSVGWPCALCGRDFVGIAATGSGKTLAFGLPGIIHAGSQPPLQRGEGPMVLVLAPTRELATQIREHLTAYVHAARHRISCIYGGVPKSEQLRDLRGGVEFLVATPGRLIDMLEMGATNLKRVTYLVLDEADRMLDMGFEPQIRKIIGQIRPDRQTLMWSATWPREVQQLAKDFLKPWIQVTVGSGELAANKDVTQHVIVCENFDKTRKLQEIFAKIGRRKTLIFTDTKRQCDVLCDNLRAQRFYAMSIHGDKSQQAREKALEKFRGDSRGILVATDVAARGLDIRDIQVVINYDFPNDIASYIHRIGRTGRAGDKGEAFSFITSMQSRLARDLVKIMSEANQHVPQELIQLSQSSGGMGRGGPRRGGFTQYRNPSDPIQSLGGRGGFGGRGGRRSRSRSPPRRRDNSRRRSRSRSRSRGRRY